MAKVNDFEIVRMIIELDQIDDEKKKAKEQVFKKRGISPQAYYARRKKLKDIDFNIVNT